MSEQNEALMDQGRRLAGLEAPAEVVAGHHDLFPGLWLSTDPGGEARMRLTPQENGFTLKLEKGDSGGWACIGLQIRPDALMAGRYLGLMVALGQSDTELISLEPALRYFHGDRMEDVPSGPPMLLNASARPVLAYMPLDRGKLETAGGCELNMFFSTNAFEAEFLQLEPLLIL